MDNAPTAPHRITYTEMAPGDIFPNIYGTPCWMVVSNVPAANGLDRIVTTVPLPGAVRPDGCPVDGETSEGFHNTWSDGWTAAEYAERLAA